MFEGKRIAVVVPAYNERPLITAAVTCIPHYVDHIIVVDDASTDGTLAMLTKSVSRPALACLRHPENRGVGAAIVSGYKEALRRGAEVVVVMAGDAQMDPADLPALILPVARGEADYAKGDRLCWPGVFSVMPLSRFIGNHMLTWMSRAVTGYWEVRDSQCGYTAISARILARMELDQLYPRYGFPNDMLAELHCCAAKLAQVPVRPIYGCEISGISVPRAVVMLPFVLCRSLLRRVLRRLSPRKLVPVSRVADRQ